MPDNNPAPKRQKRALLTNVSAAQSVPNTQHMISTEERTSIGEDYSYLLRWRGADSEEDEVVEWDKEGWDKDADEDQGVNEDEDECDSIREVKSGRDDDLPIPNGLEYENLEKQALAIRQAHQKDERRRKVPEETVVNIINDSMESFADQWYPGKDSELTGQEKEQVFDPIYLWTEAEKHGRRHHLIERYRSDIEYFKYRLDVLAAEICKLRSSEKHVRQQCKNLEVHVQNLQEAEWYLSIYETPPQDETGKESAVIDLMSTPESSESEKESEKLVGMEDVPLTRPSDPQGNHMTMSYGDSEEVLADKEVFVLSERNQHPDHTSKKSKDNRTTKSRGIQERDPPRSSMMMRFHDITPERESVQEARQISFTRLTSPTCESNSVSSLKKNEVPVTYRAPVSYRAPMSQMLRLPYRDQPEVASIFTVSQWNMADLVASKDRKRITMKILLNMSSEERRMVQTRFKAVRKSNLVREIKDYIDMLIRKKNRLSGVLSSDLPKVRLITHFFLCWWFADDYMRRAPAHEQLLELDSDLHDSDDLRIFYDWVYHISHRTFSDEALRNAHAPSQEEVIVISDDEEGTPSANPLSRKRSAKRSPIRGDGERVGIP